MALVSLTLLKQHVRADDFSDDDTYLSHLLEAAEQHVVDSTCRSVSELLSMGGGSLPPTLQQAVLMIAAHWYNQREAVSSAQMAEVPYTVQALLKPYRRLTKQNV